MIIFFATLMFVLDSQAKVSTAALGTSTRLTSRARHLCPFHAGTNWAHPGLPVQMAHDPELWRGGCTPSSLLRCDVRCDATRGAPMGVASQHHDNPRWRAACIVYAPFGSGGKARRSVGRFIGFRLRRSKGLTSGLRRRAGRTRCNAAHTLQQFAHGLLARKGTDEMCAVRKREDRRPAAALDA